MKYYGFEVRGDDVRLRCDFKYGIVFDSRRVCVLYDDGRYVGCFVVEVGTECLYRLSYLFFGG